MDGKKLVDNLISYAKKNLQLKSNDEIYFSNILASILKVEDYDYTGLIEENLDELPDNLIDELKGYLKIKRQFSLVKLGLVKAHF